MACHSSFVVEMEHLRDWMSQKDSRHLVPPLEELLRKDFLLQMAKLQVACQIDFVVGDIVVVVVVEGIVVVVEGIVVVVDTFLHHTTLAYLWQRRFTIEVHNST
jgi:hypothetical protein